MNRLQLKILVLTLLLCLVTPAFAVIEVFTFDDPVKEQRYRKLSEELRCLVCQNQNLADSNADLAKDLRNQVYNMIEAGKNDAEIIDYMVSRYGEFVLYRPPLQTNTVLLWAGPFVLLLGGLAGLAVFVRRRKATTRERMSPEEQARLRRMLEEQGGEPRS
ncbi:cytochrome c-type biogenesis protein CcmH [Thioalbus denitrificans]|uniref:Cytochrome c-type biogenesis protein n=1 Tax=Thioalbus denitrificans TaxID=547122 RepID=A0A369CDX7_9GAMM|nr:cytochrome c-type biogenesis protein CcmH [Thioalbus denitrificans]